MNECILAIEVGICCPNLNGIANTLRPQLPLCGAVKDSRAADLAQPLDEQHGQRRLVKKRSDHAASLTSGQLIRQDRQQLALTQAFNQVA